MLSISVSHTGAIIDQLTSAIFEDETCFLVLGLNRNTHDPSSGSFVPSVARTRFIFSLLADGPMPDCIISAKLIKVIIIHVHV